MKSKAGKGRWTGWLWWAMPLFVVLITGVILAIQWRQMAHIKQRAFGSLVRKTQEKAQGDIARHFDPVRSHLTILKRQFEEELPALTNTAALNARLVPVLEQLPQVSAAMVALTDGHETMLLRTPGGWRTRLLHAGRPDQPATWQRWTMAGEPGEAWEETLDYDPRRRPWFRGAVDGASTQTVFWTEPYRFFTSKAFGVTAASRGRVRGGADTDFVVAFDVLLTAVSALTMDLAVGDNGKAFILTGDGRVLGLPQDPQFSRPATVEATVLAPAATFPVPLVRDAYAAWLEAGRPDATPLSFTSGGDVWWTGFWDQGAAGEVVWLVVAVPEQDLMRRLGDPGIEIPVATGLGGLLVAVVLAYTLHALRRRTGEGGTANNVLQALLPAVDPEALDETALVRALVAAGESERLEFKSSVRWNFKAGRTGKEMELAWLKTVVAFLNTDGGVILLGIDDEGNVLGLGNDGFATDDKALRHVENLISQHVGSSHFHHLRSRVATLDDKKVVCIVIEPSSTPAFLSHDKKEAFYIRTGPASRALSSSDTLAYIDARKA